MTKTTWKTFVFLVCFVASPLATPAFADQSISQMTNGGAAQAGDSAPVVRSGANVKVQLGTAASKAASSGSASSVSSVSGATTAGHVATFSDTAGTVQDGGAFPSSGPPSGPAGGDLSGTYPNPAVSTVGGQPFAASATIDTTNATNISSGTLGNARLAALSANQLLGAVTATTPGGLSVPSCGGASNALTWTSGTGFGCNTISGGGGSPGGSSGQIQYNNSGAFGGFAVSGDGTLNTGTGALVVTKTNGSNFAASATTDTTNASNITSGTLAVINGGTPYTAVVTKSPYNASGFIVQTTTSGSVTSGTTNIPVVSSTGFSAGQVAIIALAGAGGTKNFAGFISAIPDSTHIIISNTAVAGPSLPMTATSGTTGTATTIPANYLVYSLGSTTLASSVTNGATSIQMANATSYKVGQGIYITGGAASAANLVSTITAVSGNTVTISPGISNASGAAGGANVQHDDTAAFQAAVNLASYLQNVSVFVPDGFYRINGAPSGTANSSVIFPSLDYFPSGHGLWLPQATLQISGSVPAAQFQAYIATNKIPNMNGAIIQSDLNATGTNLFAAFDANSLANFTNLQLIVKNITFRTYPSPNVVPLNAYYVESLEIYNSAFDTGDPGPTTQPGNGNFSNFALYGPSGENGGNNVMYGLEVYGYYWGINASEHTRLEHIRFDNDFWPLIVGSGISQYGITLVDTEFNGCPHGLGTANDSYAIPVSGELMNFEHQLSPSWVVNVDDISDGNNLLTGFISADSLDSPVVNVVSAINLHIVDARVASYPLPKQVFADLSNSHYATAPNGTELYCSDCAVASTCAGSGTGAMAQMLNGVWSCSSGSGGGGSGSLGTTASATNPQISGHAGYGFYTADGSTKVDVAANGAKVAEWTTTGEAVTGSITASTSVSGTAYIPTGSSAPTDGMYLPAANTTGIADRSLPVLETTGVASAVDYLTVTNSATANPASILLTPSGTDTNIGLNIPLKGAGFFTVTGGKTGLGTSTPGATLQVEAAAPGDGLIVDGTGSNAPQVGISFGGSTRTSIALALAGGQFSNVATTGDTVIRSVEPSGANTLIISNQSGGSIGFATGASGGSATDTFKMVLSNAGALSIGTTTPVSGTKLTVAGSINQSTVTSCSTGLTTDASGTINGCVASDRTLKGRITPLVYDPTVIERLQPVSYEWSEAEKEKRDAKRHIGFIAQDVQQVAPEAVVGAGKGNLGIDANAMNAILAMEVKQLHREVKGMQKEMEALHVNREGRRCYWLFWCQESSAGH